MSRYAATWFTASTNDHPTIKLFKCIEVPATDGFAGGHIEYTKVVDSVIAWVYWNTKEGKYVTLQCNKSRYKTGSAVDIANLTGSADALRRVLPVPMYEAVQAFCRAWTMGLL